jgi:signal transduction histidine kinase
MPHATVVPPPTPDELRAWAGSLVEAREDERRRIARGMHDELGQLLTSMTLDLAALATTATAPHQVERIQSLQSLVSTTLVAVRRISNDLRPLMLDDLGLNDAVEALARSSAQRMNLEITVRLDDEDPPVRPSVATAAYRIVQEALTNVARHAHATDVAIEMRMQPDGHLLLHVQDNGIGLPQDALARAGSWGLRGIRERVAMLGGRLRLDNLPGSGARIEVLLPAFHEARGQPRPPDPAPQAKDGAASAADHP